MRKFNEKINRFLQKAKLQLSQKKATRNDFINWLTFAVAGMLSDGNLYCFEYAIANLPSDSPIIEIGSFCGLSTNLMSYYLRKHNKKNKLITADKWIFEGAELNEKFLDQTNISYKQYSEFVKKEYINNISFFSKENLPFTIEQFSDDFFTLWNEKKLEKDVLGREVQLGGTISYAYIDGNHTYEFAKRDFQNVDKHLELGGFILFDDSADYSGWDVNRVVQEVKKSGKYEVVLKNPNYLFKKIA
jgi:Methyltransferase domain